MVFSSQVFLFLFLPITYLLYLIIPNLKAKNILLIIASFVFYAYGEPTAVALMILSVICNYFFGRGMSSEKYRKKLLLASVIFNMGMLFIFKYLTYSLSLTDKLFGLPFEVPDIALPIGISFFTFQAMSYVIDSYRDNSLIRKNILDIFLYISFFPQLIAGPIIKFDDISRQINERKITAENTVAGIRRFVCGLAKKLIIANAMGEIADYTFSAEPSDLNAVTAWIGALCYVMQIFYDFSGYSDMAIGLGKMFGFEFKENFNYPLSANGMTDFWRKWNISVSSWFRDYVYIPLGGNRKGKHRTVLNKWIVFLLTGIWHGANLTFVMWGVMHGFFLMMESYGIVPKKLFTKKILAPLAHLYSLLIITLTFVIFRADDISYGFEYIGRMFSGGFAVNNCFVKTAAMLDPFALTAFALGAVVAVPVIPAIRKKCIEKGFEIPYNTVATVGSLLLFMYCIVVLSGATYNPFIYFRF